MPDTIVLSCLMATLWLVTAILWFRSVDRNGVCRQRRERLEEQALTGLLLLLAALSIPALLSMGLSLSSIAVLAAMVALGLVAVTRWFGAATSP